MTSINNTFLCLFKSYDIFKDGWEDKTCPTEASPGGSEAGGNTERHFVSVFAVVFFECPGQKE